MNISRISVAGSSNCSRCHCCFEASPPYGFSLPGIDGEPTPPSEVHVIMARPVKTIKDRKGAKCLYRFLSAIAISSISGVVHKRRKESESDGLSWLYDLWVSSVAYENEKQAGEIKAEHVTEIYRQTNLTIAAEPSLCQGLPPTKVPK